MNAVPPTRGDALSLIHKFYAMSVSEYDGQYGGSWAARQRCGGDGSCAAVDCCLHGGRGLTVVQGAPRARELAHTRQPLPDRLGSWRTITLASQMAAQARHDADKFSERRLR